MFFSSDFPLTSLPAFSLLLLFPTVVYHSSFSPPPSLSCLPAFTCPQRACYIDAHPITVPPRRHHIMPAQVLFSPPLQSKMFCCRQEVLRWAGDHVKCVLVHSLSGYFTPGCLLLISPHSQHSTTLQSLIGRRGKSYSLSSKKKKKKRCGF